MLAGVLAALLWWGATPEPLTGWWTAAFAPLCGELLDLPEEPGRSELRSALWDLLAPQTR